jgi:hypothetical protein
MQTFFVYPVAVQASPTGYNIFVFEQGKPLSLIQNLSVDAHDTLCMIQDLSRVMLALHTLHHRWGSHNNLSINTVSAREPYNQGIPN